MKSHLVCLWLRFKSEVPPAVKKIQILLAIASASLTQASAITWPANLLWIGTCSSYGAAVTAFTIIILQFTQQAVNALATGANNNTR